MPRTPPISNLETFNSEGTQNLVSLVEPELSHNLRSRVGIPGVVCVSGSRVQLSAYSGFFRCLMDTVHARHATGWAEQCERRKKSNLDSTTRVFALVAKGFLFSLQGRVVSDSCTP